MDHAVLHYFKQFSFLSMDDIRAISGIVQLRRVAAGEVLVREGDRFEVAILVLRGLLRNYLLTSQGEPRTILLASEGMFAGSPEGLFHGEPSQEYTEALEPSLLLLLDPVKLKKLARRHPSVHRMMTRNLQRQLLFTVKRLRFFTVLSPEERYLAIRDEHPDLLQRVPQRHLASYIGVTPVSLSRIKARVTQRHD